MYQMNVEIGQVSLLELQELMQENFKFSKSYPLIWNSAILLQVDYLKFQKSAKRVELLKIQKLISQFLGGWNMEFGIIM